MSMGPVYCRGCGKALRSGGFHLCGEESKVPDVLDEIFTTPVSTVEDEDRTFVTQTGCRVRVWMDDSAILLRLSMVDPDDDRTAEVKFTPDEADKLMRNLKSLKGGQR